jgi:SAM-dependent methyltransferase
VTTNAVPVRDELLALLTCPEDGGALVGWNGRAESATLSCAACGREYPVVDGLPRLLPDSLRVEATTEHEPGEKRREMAARDAQVGQYDRNLPLRLFSVPEIPLTLRYLAPEPDHLLLEGGCGTGRMTPHFADRVRGLLCIDFSVGSLRAARAKLAPELAAKTLFVQADLSHLPLAPGAFDRVGSFQVLEHLPTHDTRRRAVSELSRVLKPRTSGGRLALSAYRWGPPVSLVAAKSGHHDGGIPFFRATWPELSALFAPHLDVEQHTAALLYHFLLWGRRKTA